jgi:hypothetical protein
MNIRGSLLITIFTLFGFTTTLNASIIYDADGTSVFTLVDAGGMTISASSVAEPSTTAATGTGVASIDADSQTAVALFPGTSLTQTSEVSGSAASLSGTSLATVLNSTLIALDNTGSTTSSTAEFTFSYDWLVKLTQDDPIDAMLETGVTSAFFHLTGFAPSGTETLAIDEGLGAGVVSVADWLFHPEVSFDFADIGALKMLSGSKTISVFVTVAAGSFDEFSVITDAFGSAAHIPVSEPANLLLFSLALIGFNFCRHRKFMEVKN